MINTLDQSLATVGLFGRAQFWIILAGGITHVYTGWPSVVTVFVAISVPFQCSNSSQLLDDTDFDSKCIENCANYAYQSSPSSIVSDFDLACGDGPTLVSTANSMFWVGFLVSCFCSGSLADMYGRRRISLITCISYIVVSFLLPATQNIYEFIVLRFFCGLFHYPLTAIVFILVAEWIDQRNFANIGMAICASFSLGEAFCAFAGYLLQDSWRYQLTAMASALIPVLALIFFLMPESAKWLHQVGKYEKLKTVLQTVAKRNSRVFESSAVHFYQAESKDDIGTISFEGERENHYLDDNFNPFKDNEDVTLLDLTSSDIVEEIISKPHGLRNLLGTGGARVLMFTNIICWFSACLSYYGLSFGVSTLSGNIYLNSTLLSLAEIPAWVICILMDYFGRKPTLVFCQFLSAAACSLIPVTNKLCPDLSLILALLGKLFSTAGFDLLFIYLPEQLPTVLRSTGLSLCSGVARFGAILAPYILQADSISPYIPYETIALVASVAFVLSLLFQVETNRKPMPHTVDQYYTLVQRRKFNVLFQ